MFVYIGTYFFHLLIWAIFQRDLFRWAYGVDAIPENLDREYFDYCCAPAGLRDSVVNCAVVHENSDEQQGVCATPCDEWGFCAWHNTVEDVEEAHPGKTVSLLEGETEDYCCRRDEELEMWICRPVPEGDSRLCYDYCERYRLCRYNDWIATAAVTMLEQDFCCKGVWDLGNQAGATHPCTPVASNETCDAPCASHGLCTRTSLDYVDLSQEIYWDL